MKFILIRFLKLFTFFISLLICAQTAASQSLPINQIQDEQFRLNSLLSDTLHFSLINRPYSYQNYLDSFSTNPLTELHSDGWWSSPILNRELHLFDGITIGIQPFTLQNTLNTRLPHGENNQAAWYGRGHTTEFSGGMFISTEYLTLNILPHIIYHENRDFSYPRFVSNDEQGNIRYVAEGIGAAMDAPFRFGPDPFFIFDWGNSSIRLHYREFEAGLSSEPLWWGPSNRYALAMSNNAPGIPHGFLATREPFKIPYLGSFQFRWIMGYPGESEYFDGDGSGETRVINAINLAYSPSIFNKLTIGITRLYHLYELNGFDIRNFFRIVDPISRSALVSQQGEDGTRQARNQAASLYGHLTLPRANAEIYFEFFREDHSYNLRDFIVQPHHNSAFTVGFQKISHLPIPWIDFVKTKFEYNTLTTSQLRQVRHQAYYYTHSRIRQGHTNRGQILGAAIGPGSNSQYLGMDAYRGNFKAGMFVQRVVDNDNFHFIQGTASLNPGSDFGDFFRHRVDLNIGLNFLYGPGPFYLQSRLTWTKAYNYGRFDLGELNGINITNFDRNDRTNIQLQIGLTYVF